MFKIVFLSLFTISAHALEYFCPTGASHNSEITKDFSPILKKLDMQDSGAMDIEQLSMNISGDEKDAKLEINLVQVFKGTGLDAEQMIDILTDPAKFNDVAEVVRARENGAAFQDTKKSSGKDSYMLTTSTWAKKLGVTLPLGSSRTICSRMKSAGKVTMKCQSDQSHKETNDFMKSSTSVITCSEERAAVKCSYSIVIEPRKVTKYLQTMSAHEVCFWSGLRAIRTNMGMGHLVSNSNSKTAYEIYNSSPLEQKLEKLVKDHKPNNPLSFKYP